MNVVDTSGWIAFFFGDDNVESFAPLVEDTAHLIVPTVCLYEVFKKINAVADEAKALQVVAQMKQGRIVELTEAIALRAALVSLKHHLPMADSIILTTAWMAEATLWTQDDHFSGLPGVEYIKPRSKVSSGASGVTPSPTGGSGKIRNVQKRGP